MLLPTTQADDALNSDLTALDAYIKKDDPTYAFQEIHHDAGELSDAFVIDLTSQTWLTPELVDRPIWKHELRIAVPKEVQSNTALLFIGGGRNGDDEIRPIADRFRQIAELTGSVVAELGQVPNQPLTFLNDPEKKGRFEDDLVAYTWDQYLRGADSEWLARFPMTKSAVRAMDCVTTFLATERAGEHEITQFVVAGGSKRGWTTWMAAAVDKRVVAIAPIVIDMLNVRPSFQHHFQVYGFFAPAVDDYVNAGIMEWQGTPEYDRLVKLIEPYEYRSRLTVPKLILNATGDQFFLPDSSQFYFKDLLGEKHLRYVPNADHSLRASDAYETLIAFYGSILAGQDRPELQWETPADGKLTGRSNTPPREVRLWQATNPEARDFRLETFGPQWTSELITPADDTYSVTVPTPEKGWTAYMLEFTYDSVVGLPMKFTTSVEVTPKTLPYPPFEPEGDPRQP